MLQFTFFLSPLKSVKLRFSGGSVRAVFLDLLRNFDKDLARQIHNYTGPKSFSVTPIYIAQVYKPELKILLDRVYRFRISLLQDKIFKGLLRWLVTNPIPRLSIRKLDFSVHEISIRRISFEKLIQKTNALDAFRLIFHTPTYFSQWGVDFHDPLPSPVNVFYNLIKTWNAFSPIKFDKKTFRDWVEKSVMISGYKIRTWRPVDIGGGRKATGSVGWVSYNITHHSDFNKKIHDNYRRLLHTLGKFAEIANVGGNRTGGFGVVTFHPKPKQPNKNREDR